MTAPHRRIDVETWARRDHFRFFQGFDQPCFNICADVDVTEQLATCRRTDTSFFAGSLYAALCAVNDIEAFRLRVRDDQVVCYDRVGIGATVLRDDETFAFAYIEHVAGRAGFLAAARARLDQVRRGPPALQPGDDRDDVVHTSVLPWIRFTSISHARRAGRMYVPKLVFGKHHEVGGRRAMPVSVEAHHALVDGWHVAQFLQAFQRHLDVA